MNNKFLPALVTGLSLWVVSLAATAAGLSYSYGEIGYQHLDADNYDGKGGRLNISYGATDHIFVKMGFARLTIETPTLSSIDTDRFNIGIGGHMPVSDNIDVLGVVSYLDNEYSGSLTTEADEGYQVDLGVRGKVSKKVELNATASFRHMGLNSAFGVADDDDTGFELGTVIKLKKKLNFSGNVSYFDESEEMGVFLGVRLNL